MAQPTNTYDAYDAVGIREDLLDSIYNVDPSDTPFLSGMNKGKTTSTLHEWQTDVLDAPSASNKRVQGGDSTATAITPTVRLNNRTQIFSKVVTIAATLEATNRAGRGKEAAYQSLLKAKALKTDMEMSVFQNGAKVAGSGVVAPELAGVNAWLTSNTSAGTGGSDATGDGTDTRTDGTQRPLTEALLKGVVKSIYDNSGEQPDTMYVGSFNKQTASGFTGAATARDESASGKRVTGTVEIYEHDFGTLRIVPARHIRQRDAILVSHDRWCWTEQRPMAQKPLARTGDSIKFDIIAEATLECKNEKASGGIYDLTTS